MSRYAIARSIVGTLGFLLSVSGRPASAGPADPPPLVSPSPGPQGQDPSLAEVRRVGPPTATPQEDIPPAPGPGYFYIPGQYVPAGENVVWRAGFWARSQPGWEWVPARWDRLAEGWSYREGHWERSVSATPSPSPSPTPSVVSSPAPGASPFSPPPSGVPSPPRPGLAGDVKAPIELAPLPEAAPETTPAPGSSPSTSPPTPPAAGTVPAPAPAPAPAPPASSGISGTLRLPVTDIFIPGGWHIQVVPGRPPSFGQVPYPYSRSVVPGVQLRPGPTVQEVRDMVKGLTGVTLP
jgi:hypothetical protein